MGSQRSRRDLSQYTGEDCHSGLEVSITLTGVTLLLALEASLLDDGPPRTLAECGVF